MVTIKDNSIVITLDLPAENLPDYQNSLIRMLGRVDKNMLDEKTFAYDLYIYTDLLSSLMLDEFQAKEGLKFKRPGKIEMPKRKKG